MLIVCLVLAVLTAAAYSQVFKCGFTNFDDQDYVTENLHIQRFSSQNLAWAFKAVEHGTWQPLVWLSYMLDDRLYGMTPMGFHLTNFLFHLANTLLLFFVLRQMTLRPGSTSALWKSAFVAALFALHPLHVESVAWIAERKDVLSTFFWLATMMAYTSYARAAGSRKYVLVMILFALGLMAKPMLITLPFALLLLDYWPLDRVKGRGYRSLVIEKLPLIALSVCSSVITFIAQSQAQAVRTLDSVPMNERLANALVSYESYLFKTVWPAKLAVFYPLIKPSAWQVGGAVLFLIAMSYLVIRVKRPYFTVGWLWYLGTLIPTIGIIQIGLHAMADRFTYVPLIGIFVAAAWGIPDVLRRSEKTRSILAAIACVMILVFAVFTWIQVGYWRDSESLFTHAIDVTEGNYMAHMNLGMVLSSQGRADEAIEHYRETIAIHPKWSAGGHYNIGVDLWDRGDLNGAIAEFRETIRFDPKFVQAHCNLGLALKEQNKTDEAIMEYRTAIRLKPDMQEAHNNLAVALYDKEDYAEAWKEVHLCQEQGGAPHPGFLQALAEKMPDPGN